MQDEIVARLASAPNIELLAAEARSAELVPNPTSMDFCFQGRAWLNKGATTELVARAGSFFDRALAVDPQNIDALVGSALADAIAGTSLFVGDPRSALAAAEGKLAKVLSSVPDHARAHMTWDLSAFQLSPPPKASLNVSTLWRWIQTSPLPIPSLGLARFS